LTAGGSLKMCAHRGSN